MPTIVDEKEADQKARLGLVQTLTANLNRVAHKRRVAIAEASDAGCSLRELAAAGGVSKDAIANIIASARGGR